jgi:antitoxin component YwqK of YwqJK toxin-antitoxin module
LNNKEYYVYGLIDPRDNQYFYIGKGKGKRYNSHLKENIKNVKNIFKYSRIKEIQAENLEVKIEILFPYLTEKIAFTLEKIIIYKIGRKSFREGNLLNFAPGGIWSPGESLFYNTKPSIDFDLGLLDFVAQEKFLSIKKTSTIIHLDEISPEYLIYKYDLDGILISIDTIVCFFKDKNAIDLFFEISNEKLPLYFAGFIYSKKPIIDFYFSERLMSLNQHLFDPLFLKELDDKLTKKNDFALELKQNGLYRINVKLENDILKIETFYPNNDIQNIQYLKDGKPNGKWFEYYENGQLKYITEYFSSGKLFTRESYSEKGHLQFKNECFKNGRIKKSWNYYSNGSPHYFDEHCENWKMALRTFYYPNGEKKYSYNNFKEHIEYSYYNENGKLIEEFVYNKGYLKYNLSSEIISVSNTKHMDFIDPYKVLEINQTKSFSNKINIKEKRESDEDWKLFNDYLNNIN